MLSFSDFLESQIPFTHFNNLIARVGRWIRKLEMVGGDHRFFRDINDIKELLGYVQNPNVGDTQSRYISDDRFVSLKEDIHKMAQKLQLMGQGELASEGYNLYSELDSRFESRSQKDMFSLRYSYFDDPRTNANTETISPSRFRVPPTQWFKPSKDLKKKQTLIKLYNWAVNKLSKYKESHPLLSSLEKDVYDELTWKAIADLAEEKDMNTAKIRIIIDNLFNEKPRTIGPRDNQITGW